MFCNSSPLVLGTLASASGDGGEDCGFVVRSKEELILANDCIGIDPSRILFKSDLLMASHLKMAAKYGVGMVAFATAADLNKIKKNYPGAK